MSKILTVEFNDHSIKFMEGNRKGKTLHVLNKGEIDLPDGLLSDGMIKNLEEVTDALNKLIENSVKHRKAMFLINSNSVFIRKMELPYVKKGKETKSMINFKLQEMLPSYIYQYTIMFKTSEIYMSEGVKKARYIVYGIPVKMYENYLKISERLKLRLVSIDISSNFIDYMLRENIADNKAIKKDITAFINAGKSSINLSIINKGITELFRIAAYDPDGTSSLKSIDEIYKYMKYYSSLVKDNIIEKIYLLGESVNDEVIENISDFGAEVEPIIEIPGINIDGLYEKEDFYNYFNLSASFYAGKNHIDFLTEKKNRQKYKFAAVVAVMSVIIIISAVLSYNFLSLYLKNNMLENEASAKKIFLSNTDNILLNNEIENIKKKIVLLENYISLASKVEDKSRQDNLINSELFVKIKSCAPDDTIINSFFTDINYVEMNCESSNLDSVALFVENLRKIGFVDNVNMTNVAVKKDGEVSKYTYAVTCYLKGDDYEKQ